MTKRRYPRVQVIKRAFVEDISGSEESMVGAAIVYQLGAMGCGLRTMETLVPGTRIRVTFYDDNDDNALCIRGRVVFGLHEPEAGYCSYGIVFERIEEGAGNLTNTLLDMALLPTGFPLIPEPG